MGCWASTTRAIDAALQSSIATDIARELNMSHHELVGQCRAALRADRELRYLVHDMLTATTNEWDCVDGFRGHVPSNREVLLLAVCLAQSRGTGKLRLILEDMRGERTNILARGLARNTTLTSLWLDHTQIGDEEAIVLAEALKTNTGLKDFALDHNNITSRGAIAVLEAAMHHPKLEYISFAWNPIEEPGMPELIEVGKRVANVNKVLMHVSYVCALIVCVMCSLLKVFSTLAT